MKNFDIEKTIQGVALLKKDIVYPDGFTIESGKQAIITAWLPEDNVHTVWFEGIRSPKCWINFKNIDEFNEHFDYELK